MEQRIKGNRPHKKSLKRRMLLNISVVLVCALVISAGAGYFYFNDIIKEQKIADERNKIRQFSYQIEMMTEDIDNFAKSIIVDEALQGLLENKNPADEFEKVRNTKEIARRLTFYNSLRTYISTSFLEMSSGERYSSSVSTVEENYLEEKFGSDEISRYNTDDQAVFSDPYRSIESGNSRQVISYRTNMWDIHAFGEPQGALYTEVFLEYFMRPVRTYGEEYDNVCLLGNRNIVLYEQDPGGSITEFLAGSEQDKLSGVYKITGGYLIFEEIESTGWTVCTMITNRYLWERSNFVLKFFAVIFILSIVILLLVTSRIMESMIRPITRLSMQMEGMDYGRLDPGEKAETGDEIETLYECFEQLLCDIRKGMEEQRVYEQHKKEMEFDIVLSQIHPHYLYNVLNTVVYMAAAEKNTNIVKMVNALIYTLQETLNLGDHNVDTTIEKELELVEHYITIQRYRYPGIFDVDISCDEQYKSYLVPKTIIQPLLENAIVHGILPKDQTGCICIRIEEEEGQLCITVEDDGVGISDECLELFEKDEMSKYEKNGRKHIGISNIRDRIRHLYGPPYDMYIVRKDGGGTCIKLYLPIINRAEKDI